MSNFHASTALHGMGANMYRVKISTFTVYVVIKLQDVYKYNYSGVIAVIS